MIKQDLVLVLLSDQQIEAAKEKNGQKKRITHALICGSYGKIFGTEKHCRKYFSAWSKIFTNLFKKPLETNDYKIESFQSTFDLVNILIKSNDDSKATFESEPKSLGKTTTKKKGFFAKLFS